MATCKSTEAHDRLLSSPSLDPPRAARTRQGLLRLAREAIQLSRVDRKAGDRVSALRWLALASHLRVTAGALNRTEVRHHV